MVSAYEVSRACGMECHVCEELRRVAVGLAVGLGVTVVTAADLAEAAGMPVERLAGHRDADPRTCICDAYLERSGSLQRDFIDVIVEAPSWREGFERAVQRLLRWAAQDPVTARFCFAEVLRGDRELLQLREEMRQRSVAMLAAEYEARHAGDAPRLHMELLVGSVTHAIADAVELDEATSLPGRVDDVLAVAGFLHPVG